MELVFDWHKASLLGNTEHHLIKVSKCKFMLLDHSSHLGDFSSLSLSIRGEDLERVDCYKYLGFILNQRLSRKITSQTLPPKYVNEYQFNLELNTCYLYLQD